jgi:predicted RecA/RadA family phage recombinase
MQSQTHFSDKITVEAPSGGHTVNEPVQVGSLLGFPLGTVAEGDRSTVLLRGAHGTNNVLANEVWTAGDPLYWHELAQVFTLMETDWPVGWAAEDKATATSYGVVALDNPRRIDGLVLAPFDVSLMAASLFAVGNHLLRTIGEDRLLTKVEIFMPTAITSGGSATVVLGDGSGSNNQILTSTAIGDLDPYQDVTPDDGGTPAVPDVSVDAVSIGIGTAALNGGKFSIRVEYAPV